MSGKKQKAPELVSSRRSFIGKAWLALGGLAVLEAFVIVIDFLRPRRSRLGEKAADIIEAGKKLQVIARAGVGIDNVDVEAATRLGVVVVNAPTGNTVPAAEHAIALLMASARNIAQANNSLRHGDWRRNEFMGTELRGKTLGIIGLGNVGSEVARRAQPFEMKLLGIDPLVSMEYAQKIQVELVDMKRLLDFKRPVHINIRRYNGYAAFIFTCVNTHGHKPIFLDNLAEVKSC